MRRHVMLAAAGCAVIATAACTATADSPNASPVAAPSASSGTGAAAHEGAGSAPSSVPTRSPAPTPSASPSPAGRKPSPVQAGTDWKRVAFKTLGCKHHADLPDKAEGSSVVFADLTGDGRQEAIVKGSCPTSTATNEVHVFVYGASNPGKVLLDIGKGQYLRQATVDVSDRTIALDAVALSDDAPRCCPDLTVTQSWKWTGSRFRTSGATTTKMS